LITIIAALGALLGMQLIWWEQNRNVVHDSFDQLHLQNTALDIVEQVTSWLLTTRPGDPQNGTLAPIVLSTSDTPERLELRVPDGAYEPPAEKVEVRLKVQWCRYQRDGDLPAESADDWPPSLSEQANGNEAAFVQSFAQSRTDSFQAGRVRFAPWRIIVAVGTRDADGKSRRVTVERLVLVGD